MDNAAAATSAKRQNTLSEQAPRRGSRVYGMPILQCQCGFSTLVSQKVQHLEDGVRTGYPTVFRESVRFPNLNPFLGITPLNPVLLEDTDDALEHAFSLSLCGFWAIAYQWPAVKRVVVSARLWCRRPGTPTSGILQLETPPLNHKPKTARGWGEVRTVDTKKRTRPGKMPGRVRWGGAHGKCRKAHSSCRNGRVS